MNHLALVDRARGGSELRIGDGRTPGREDRADNQSPKENPMSDIKTRTILVDGLSVETTDAGAQAIAKLQGQLKDAETATVKLVSDHNAAIAAKDAEIAKKDAEIDSMKGKVLDTAQLDARVQARADLIADAKAIHDTDYSGKSDAEIRKAAVVAKLGDAAVKDKSDAYIDARFDILVEDSKKDPVTRALRSPHASTTVNDNGYAESVQDLQRGRTEREH
jgi:hypothetical protein